MNSLSLVIPLYNEEENIPPLLSAIRNTVPLFCSDFEVILVNDASTDKTPELVNDLARNDPKIKVIHNPKNRKLGGSLKEGFSIASKDLVLYFDADLPFDLNEIKKALFIMEEEKADCVFAYRINRCVDGLRRTIYSYVYNKLIHFLFGYELTDVNFAFKLFKRNVLLKLNLQSEGSFINAEILLKLRTLGFRIMQFPTLYYPRKKGKSTLSSLKVILKIIKELCGFYRLNSIQDLQLRKQTLELLGLYKKAPWWVRGYLYARHKTCPFRKIEPYLPKEGNLLDLGCGFGILDLFAYRKSPGRIISVIDWQDKRISYFKDACKDHNINISFISADFNSIILDRYDCIVLTDVLYLYSFEQKKELISKISKALSVGGKLIIKDMNVACLFKYYFCFIQELIFTKICKINRSKGIHIVSKRKMTSLLLDCGFSVETINLDKGYLYPHIMYSCIKK